MQSKTISITIPDQLEQRLQSAANSLGISRSRFICNLLFDWQKKNTPTTKLQAEDKDGIESRCQIPIV